MANLTQKPVSAKTPEISMSFTHQLSAIMPVKNGTPAGVSALQASLQRGKELVN